MSLYFEDAVPHFLDPDGFAEPFVYVPAETGAPLGADGFIYGVRDERPASGGMDPGSDAQQVTVDFAVADVGEPHPGDRVTRQYDGEVMEVTTPINRDGAGMVRVTLQKPEG